jgi:hypothetical protein
MCILVDFFVNLMLQAITFNNVLTSFKVHLDPLSFICWFPHLLTCWLQFAPIAT